jgi:hypothetical protein
VSKEHQHQAADGQAAAVLAEVEDQANPLMPVAHELDWEELIKHVTGHHGCDRAGQWMQAVTQGAIAREVRRLQAELAPLDGMELPPHIAQARQAELQQRAQGISIDTGAEFAEADGWAELQDDHAGHHAARWASSAHPLAEDGTAGPRGIHWEDPVFAEARGRQDREEE